MGKGRGGRGCHLRCDCATSALCLQQRFNGLLAAHPSGMLHKPAPSCINRRSSAQQRHHTGHISQTSGDDAPSRLSLFACLLQGQKSSLMSEAVTVCDEGLQEVREGGDKTCVSSRHAQVMLAPALLARLICHPIRVFSFWCGQQAGASFYKLCVRICRNLHLLC